MAEFEIAKTASVSMHIPLKADGTIKTMSETSATAGVKKTSIDGIKATATLAESATVFNTFWGTIADTEFDSLNAKKTTSQGVEE